MIDLDYKCDLLAQAAKLYYEPDGDEQSPLSDYEYDLLKDEIIEQWNSVSTDWKEILGPKEDLRYTSMHVPGNLRNKKWKITQQQGLED